MFSRSQQLCSLSLAIGFAFFSASAPAQSGWQLLKDKSGSCQLSVPANWSLLSLPGHAASPEHLGTTVIQGRVAFRQFHMSKGEMQTLNVDTVFENSAQRVFYSAKSGGTPPAVIYHVEVPGRTNACIAEISSTPAYSVDEVKKIAATLAAVH